LVTPYAAARRQQGTSIDASNVTEWTRHLEKIR